MPPAPLGWYSYFYLYGLGDSKAAPQKVFYQPFVKKYQDTKCVCPYTPSPTCQMIRPWSDLEILYFIPQQILILNNVEDYTPPLHMSEKLSSPFLLKLFIALYTLIPDQLLFSKELEGTEGKSEIVLYC